MNNQITSNSIGLAGCGRMGLPMLAALKQAGFNVAGFDVRPKQDFDECAGDMIEDPADFIKDRNILLTVVRDVDQTEDVLFGTQGFATKDNALSHIIICSTLSPNYVKALRQRVPASIGLVDAPMSGAAIAARERRLSFMLGGDDATLDGLQPLFDAMGSHFHRMGSYGAGMSAKVLNNLLAACSTAMTRLVLDWAASSGVDAQKLLALINDSSGQNWFASNFDDIEFARDGNSPDNTIGILIKDVESALDAAPKDTDTSLPEAVIAAIANLKPIA